MVGCPSTFRPELGAGRRIRRRHGKISAPAKSGHLRSSSGGPTIRAFTFQGMLSWRSMTKRAVTVLAVFPSELAAMRTGAIRGVPTAPLGTNGALTVRAVIPSELISFGVADLHLGSKISFAFFRRSKRQIYGSPNGRVGSRE